MTVIAPSLTPTHDDHSHGHAGGHHGHPKLSFVKKYIFSTDHKIIGIQFLFMGLLFFVVGGLLALVVRWQLAWPNDKVDGYKPVPLLGKYLWKLKFDSTAPIGAITSVNAATGEVVVESIADPATIKAHLNAGDVINTDGGNLKVTEVAPNQIKAKLEAGAQAVLGAPARGKWTGGAMPSDYYASAFTMHASIMIFFVIIPLLVGTYGNFLIPLKIGAEDMAFPFLNGVAFWSAIPAGALMVGTFFLPGGPSISGWTVYPPLSSLVLNEGMIPYAAPVTWVDEIAMFLRLHDPAAISAKFPTGTMGTWPPFALFMNFLALFLTFSFICSYHCRRQSIFLSAVAAFFFTKLFQFLAFDGQSAWFLSVFILGFSSILGAVNYLTTIIKLRAAGMTMFRLPLSVWSLFITSILVLLATPVLASTLFMNLLDHHRWTSFFATYNWTLSGQIQDTAGGGYPLLHQHLFWFYSHPAVYIMILPGMGMVSDILSVFARKPIFGYRPMIYAMAGIAFLGFIVWAHHMFQSGMNPTLGTTFAVATMFIAVPSAIKTFNWLGTLWGGNIRFTAPMLNAISFVALFVIGGLSGIFMASTAIDVHIHDTYFIVAHIHYVLFGGSTFAIFAALQFWYPKMFGRMMNDTIGRIHWLLSFVFFNGCFFPMHILGIGGFARRIADYTDYPIFKPYVGMNQFITWCALGLGATQILLVINFIGSWLWGKRAGRNPWEATTLEWETPSPPPHGNFAVTPVVHHGPYEYASPLVEEDYLPQTRWIEGADKLAMAKH